MKISTNINKDVEFVLIDNKSLNKRIKELGKEITKDYKGKNPVLLCLLKGSLHFMTKLAENITLPIEYECLKASSYANTVSTGKVSVLVNMLNSIKDKDVIIVEDIVDTGHTMKNILEILEKEGAISGTVCSSADHITDGIWYDRNSWNGQFFRDCLDFVCPMDRLL
jgi:hypoxanthine phosphoribosyltransferase